MNLTLSKQDHSQQKRPLLSTGILWITLLLICGLFLLYVLYFNNGPYSIYDDSFISFRYARNFANGFGLVFNPGERVEGYTNFLWTILLAGAIALNIDVVVVSKLITVVAAIATLFLLYFLVTQQIKQKRPALLAVLMLATTTSFVRYAVSGFETIFFGFLILLGIYLYLQPTTELYTKPAAGMVLACAALTRPEGVMIYGVVTAHYLYSVWSRYHVSKKGALRLSLWVVGFTAIYAPYFYWRYSYYGYLLPNTFYTKVGGPSWIQAKRGLDYLTQVMGLLIPQATVCLVVGLFWSGPRQTILLLYGLLITWLVYIVAVGGDQLKFFGPRFVIPLLPLIYIVGAGGMAGLARKLGRKQRNLFWAASLGFILTIFIVWSNFERQGYLHLQNSMHFGWKNSADWLAENADPDSTIAVDAAGIIPFYTNFYTIDMLGLNDLHIAHLNVPVGGGLPGHEKYDPAYVLARKPTYLTSWLNTKGEAISPGLPLVTSQLKQEYYLLAVTLMRYPTAGQSSIIVTPEYTPELHRQGYIYGIFHRKKK